MSRFTPENRKRVLDNFANEYELRKTLTKLTKAELAFTKQEERKSNLDIKFRKLEIRQHRNASNI